jgi:hypothetical protein
MGFECHTLKKKKDNFEIPVIPDKKTREQLEGPSIS